MLAIVWSATNTRKTGENSDSHLGKQMLMRWKCVSMQTKAVHHEKDMTAKDHPNKWNNVCPPSAASTHGPVQLAYR
eukprot:SAG11_NODE_9424_length_913_cov_1.007371_1_plen_75_part_10